MTPISWGHWLAAHTELDDLWALSTQLDVLDQ